MMIARFHHARVSATFAPSLSWSSARRPNSEIERLGYAGDSSRAADLEPATDDAWVLQPGQCNQSRRRASGRRLGLVVFLELRREIDRFADHRVLEPALHADDAEHERTV